MGEKITYEINEKGVAILTIGNPPMNALDELTMLELEFIIHQIEVEERVRAVVITGSGPTFVVGADINKVKDVQTSEEGDRLTGRAHQIMDLIENLRKPVIAAINGSCLGGGTELAMACHIRIAGEQVQMGLPEIMLGIMPAFGGTQRAARQVGRSKALELILTGRFIGAAEALSIGLLNKVVPQDKVLDEALDMAKGLSYKSPLAMAAILEAVIDGGGKSLEDGLALERRCFGRLVKSDDKKEGIAAFFEKRKPQFKGK
jgi:enoyl-CoA hydratase/carnithine racemase